MYDAKHTHTKVLSYDRDSLPLASVVRSKKESANAPYRRWKKLPEHRQQQPQPARDALPQKRTTAETRTHHRHAFVARAFRTRMYVQVQKESRDSGGSQDQGVTARPKSCFCSLHASPKRQAGRQVGRQAQRLQPHLHLQ